MSEEDKVPVTDPAGLAILFRDIKLIELLEVRREARKVGDMVTLRACDEELRRRDKLITDARKLTH